MAQAVCGVIMAGGLSRRMGGGDKCLRALGGKSILQHIVDRLRPQVETLVLNANGDPARFSGFNLPLAADSVEGSVGPLAGVLSGLDWAAENAPDCPWLLSAPSDAPFLPDNLAEKLLDAVATADAEMACASSLGRDHPVVGLWPVALRAELQSALVGEEMRKVDRWTARYRLVAVDFPQEETPAGPLDPFFNTNRPEDLEAAARYLSG